MSIEFDHIIINSKDKSNTDGNNPVFNINCPLIGKYCIRFFAMTNNIFNITSNNNKIYFNDGLSNWTGSITPGFYYANTDFCTAIKNAMEDQSTRTYTVSLGTNDNKLTIAQSVGNLTLLFGTNTLQSSARIMGFLNVDSSASTSQISSYPVDIGGSKLLYIDIMQNNIGNIFSTSNIPFSFIIPNDNAFGGQLIYEDNDNSAFVVQFKYCRSLMLKFYDEYNNAVDLNNSNYTLMLRKYPESNINSNLLSMNIKSIN